MDNKIKVIEEEKLVNLQSPNKENVRKSIDYVITLVPELLPTLLTAKCEVTKQELINRGKFDDNLKKMY